MTASPRALARLVAGIRACRICADILEPNQVVRVSHTARILIVGQAPGMRVHKTGLPFNDPSGDRLRSWMGIERETFYDTKRIAIAGMAFCFPGYDANGADIAPPKICAQHWRARLMAALPPMPLILLVGSYAQTWHLGEAAKSNMTETVRAWREFAPHHIPLPHPSWRNNGWLKKNPWFERELLPTLRKRVQASLSS
jgi:uracil-DNA glycosylase family 4